MSSVRTLAFLMGLGVSATGGAALAQSTGAPAGMESATAPGGTEGLAGPRNERNAIRDGDAVVVPPGRSRIESEVPPPGERISPPPTRN